ncbi:MAG: sodium:calcium antiporter [Anaerolineae bacterium]|nr:sodium:calcium antiporter [Anaerolineae bacterium]
MPWLTFVLSAAVIVFAASQLARYGDVIAVRTRLGGMFIGTLLLAGATSLPEFLTAINSVRQGVPNLTAGDFFGSCMFNMLLLAILDAVFRQQRILRQVALTHALTAALAALLLGLVVFFMMADISWSIGWVGVDSIVIILTYVGGVRLIQLQGMRSGTAIAEPEVAVQAGTLGLGRAVVGFVGAAIVLALAVPYMVSSSAHIAEITGLGTGIVGVVLVAFVTSLPETVATLMAVRMGAFDLAVGNLFGSNVFNIFALAMVDLFYRDGRFLQVIDPGFALAGLLGLLMVCLGLIGNLARLERRVLFIEVDALFLIIVYIVGIYLLYARGIGM